MNVNDLRLARQYRVGLALALDTLKILPLIFIMLI